MDSIIKREQLLQDSHLLSQFKIGLKVELQLLDSLSNRHMTKLVGMVPGKYVIVRFDEEMLPAEGEAKGLVVVCRYIIEDEMGDCFAFKSQIMQLIRHPDRLMFLSFPDEIHRRALRSSKRVAISLKASIQPKKAKAKALEGIVKDISNSGCRFVFDASYKGKKVNHMPIHIHLVDEKLGLDEAISGEIKNSKYDAAEGLSVGIQFDQPQQYLDSLGLE